MLDLAVRHDVLPVNAARSASRVHRPKRETKALRPEQLGEIRAAVRLWATSDRPGPKPSSDMADIIDLMLATGCRLGEVLALRWSDISLDGARPTLTENGTIKTERAKGTYRKPTPKSDASVRTIVLPEFAVTMLRCRHDESEPNALDAVFVTRNGTSHQVVNIERRWRATRRDTGFEWVTPHTFRKTVATLISEQVGSEEASRQLGHSSSQITLEHYIARPSVAAGHAELVQAFADRIDGPPESHQTAVEGSNMHQTANVYDQ